MQAVINFLLGHQAVLAGAIVAILDLVFALVPSAASNGILHWVYLQVAKLAGKSA